MVLSEEKLESVVASLEDDVKLIAQKYFLSGGSVEDLVQEGLIGLVDGINCFDDGKGGIESPAFKPFVLMCAKRQILDAVRRANSNKNTALNKSISLSSEEYELGAEVLTDSIHLSPEEIVMDIIDKEEKTQVISIMLSDTEKQVLDLYLDGCKQSEIAVQLNKSVKSIDNTLQRIKNKIKGKG